MHVHVRRGSPPQSVVIERREAMSPGSAMAGLPMLLRSPTPGSDWRSWLLLAWVAGTALVAARWFFAMLGAWRLVQRAEPVYDLEWLELKERVAFGLDLERPVRLLRSEHVAVPVACGITTPAVLLPADADAWSEDRREVVLTHEMAHILRRDCASQLVAQAATVVHWFNPLAWVAHRRFLLEREHACDDYVINNGARASDYADHLMSIARRFRRDALSLSATAPMARRSNLEGRILSILSTDQNRGGASRGRLAAFGVLALALVLPLAAFHPVEAEPDERVAHLAPAEAKAEPLPVSRPEALTITRSNRDDTFTWEGRVAPGGFVEVYGVNGSIRARAGSGDRVRVEAEKESDRGREDEVEVVVREFANGVVVCVVYPGQRGDCQPGQGTVGNIRDTDVEVAFDIELPQRVHLVGQTVNGSVKTGTLGADVDLRTVNGSIETASQGDVTARTVNGSVKAEAAGIVRAETVNGSIEARMGRADWDGTLSFSTTNGSITLDLPDDFSAEVRAEAGTGSIKSDFPLDIRRDGYTGSSATGRIGDDARRLRLDVLNGSIKLRRAGSVGSLSERQHRLEERQRQIEERDLDYDYSYYYDYNFDYDYDYSYDYDYRYDHDWDSETRAASLALVEEALANVGPDIGRAIGEASRAMVAVDVEGVIASALAGLDWADVQVEIEQSLADVEIHWDGDEWEEAWENAEEDLCDALEDLRDELDDLEDDLAEDRLSREERQELRVARQALHRAEREVRQSLLEVRRHQPHDENCSDDR